MCGITGFLSRPNSIVNPRAVIEEMTTSLIHRGPDDFDYYLNQTDQAMIAFGHRRLSILDLSESSKQPFLDEKKIISLVFNGEIYNFIELQKELIALGWTFSTKGDVEVLSKAYLQWGKECFTKFNGMWAIAIWDTRTQKLILSRDRIGKKPLYFSKIKNSLIFGSEIKAIQKHPYFKAKINNKRVYRYISQSYRYFNQNNDSFFEDVHEVPAASILEFDSNLNCQKSSYFTMPSEINNDISDQDAIQQFKELFFDAVKIRLRSDVPVSAMLSGGLDSTSIVSVASKIYGYDLNCYSAIMGKEEGIYDESIFIKSVLEDTGLNGHWIHMQPAELLPTISEMLSFYDEPICTVSWYSLFLLMKQIKSSSIKVVLNGHGGDELLGGYWDHYHYNFYDLFHQGKIDQLNSEIEHWKNNHGRNPLEISRTIQYISKMSKDRSLEHSKFTDYSYLLNPQFQSENRNWMVEDIPHFGELDRRLRMELLHEATPIITQSEDRNSMSQSIEARSPFLDHRLVSFCFSLPNHFKIRNGLGKWLLRESMKGILPEDVRLRKDKAGLIAPADKWFRTINKQDILKLIQNSSNEFKNILDPLQVQLLFDEHCSKNKNHQMVLWQIINLHLWMEQTNFTN
ncbi:asparagine synthase (glutamine-hydrolyzing) [bacterium]|nr:asparagine synthase (glutamine-hydrolyzing) [bacterium]